MGETGHRRWLSDPFFVRNLVYGIEDSLVSTTGVVAGVALAGFTVQHVVVTGSIVVLVEALSMAFGSFVAEDAFIKTAGLHYTPIDVAKYAAVMFASYAAAGVVPLAPFLLRLQAAWAWSIGLAMVALYALLHTFQAKPKKAALQTGIGGVIMWLGMLAGGAMKDQ